MIEKCFWASLFLLLASVQSTNGIKCYHCIDPIHDRNGDCAKNGGRGKLVDCDSSDAKSWMEAVAKVLRPFGNVSMKGWDEQPPNACIKLTYSDNHFLGYYGINKNLTTRTCMVAVDNSQGCTNRSRIEETVLTKDDRPKNYTRKQEICICTDDLCNGSQSTMAGLFFVVFTSATSIAISKLFS